MTEFSFLEDCPSNRLYIKHWESHLIWPSVLLSLDAQGWVWEVFIFITWSLVSLVITYARFWLWISEVAVGQMDFSDRNLQLGLLGFVPVNDVFIRQASFLFPQPFPLHPESHKHSSGRAGIRVLPHHHQSQRDEIIFATITSREIENSRLIQNGRWWYRSLVAISSWCRSANCGLATMWLFDVGPFTSA